MALTGTFRYIIKKDYFTTFKSKSIKLVHCLGLRSYLALNEDALANLPHFRAQGLTRQHWVGEPHLNQ